MPGAAEEWLPEEREAGVGGARQQVLHLVEEEERAAVLCEKALGEPELLQPLAPARLIAVVVRLADAVEGHAEPLGEHLAELGLARPRRTVEQDVHARRGSPERTLDQALDVVAALGDMVEIRPFQLACRCCVQQQAVHVVAGAVRHRRQPPQAVDRRHVAVAVDGNEPRAYQRRFVGEAAVNGIGRYAEECGHGRSPDVSGLVRRVER